MPVCTCIDPHVRGHQDGYTLPQARFHPVWLHARFLFIMASRQIDWTDLAQGIVFACEWGSDDPVSFPKFLTMGSAFLVYMLIRPLFLLSGSRADSDPTNCSV